MLGKKTDKSSLILHHHIYHQTCWTYTVFITYIDIDMILGIHKKWIYHNTSNIRRTLVGNKLVDPSDVVGASPVGAAPATSSLST